MPYLFSHFKEKITPDGEQVYFSVSRDGVNWEKVNGGEPVLTSTLGTCGCRDIEVVRLHTGGFVVLTTDLCIANIMDEKKSLENYRSMVPHVLTVNADTILRTIDSDSIFGINHRYAFNGYGSFDSSTMTIKEDFKEL